MTGEWWGCCSGESAWLTAWLCPLWAKRETRALFLLQKHDPLSPHTFELGAKIFNRCDLCDLHWPTLASNPPAVRLSSCPVPLVCRGKRRSTPLGLRSDPPSQGHNTTGIIPEFPREHWGMTTRKEREIHENLLEREMKSQSRRWIFFLPIWRINKEKERKEIIKKRWESMDRERTQWQGNEEVAAQMQTDAKVQ